MEHELLMHQKHELAILKEQVRELQEVGMALFNRSVRQEQQPVQQWELSPTMPQTGSPTAAQHSDATAITSPFQVHTTSQLEQLSRLSRSCRPFS